MNKYRTLLFLLVVLLFACKKDDNSLGIEMIFEETQCANPWEALPNSKDYLLNVHEYLNSEGIEVYSISIETTDSKGIHCDACNCFSGRIIKIRIPETDKEKAETVGFL